MAILFGPVASLGVQAQQYYLTDLGPGVSPTDISNDGTIVGSYTKPGETLGTAFRYSGSGAFEDIGGPGSVATGVNDLGQVVGNTPDGAFLLEGSIVEQWSGYKAYGISELGWISGSAVMENPHRTTPKPLAPAVFTGEKWEVMDIADVYSRGTRDGVYADLYALKAINWGGIAVGERRKYGLAGSSAISVAYPYTDVISAADVEYLSTGGTAEAINDAGTIVGTGSNGEAFLCDDGSCVGLGTLQNADGEYGLRSSAYDVNEAGQVVGNSWLVAVNTSVYDPSQYHAVLWDSDGTIQDLNDMAGTELGWVLTSATAINYNGDIVGTGLLNGEPHGFLLTAGASTILPPAPLPPAEAEPSAPNESPVAIASADTVRGKAPLTVTFSSAGSYDPEGLGLTYEWTFGDASTVSNDENPEPHTYTEPGDYVATLVVADEAGNPSDPAVVKIRVQKGRSK
jgi:probable HAF family extracellular repeat protein